MNSKMSLWDNIIGYTVWLVVFAIAGIVWRYYKGDKKDSGK